MVGCSSNKGTGSVAMKVETLLLALCSQLIQVGLRSTPPISDTPRPQTSSVVLQNFTYDCHCYCIPDHNQWVLTGGILVGFGGFCLGRLSVTRPSGLHGSPSLLDAEEMASWSNIVPGSILAVFYSDDTVWHERLALWRASDSGWMILTPDNDRYIEDLRGNALDGPERVKVKGHDFRYWSRVGGPAYRFAALPSTDEFKTMVKDSYKELCEESHFDRAWRPDIVLDMDGKTHPAGEFLKSLLVTHRLPPRGGGVVAHVDDASAQVKQRRLIDSIQKIQPAPPGLLWVACEAKDGHSVGEVIAVDPARDVMMGEVGLFQCDTGWLRLQQMTEAERVKMIPEDPPSKPAEPLAAKPSTSTESQDEDSGDARTLFVDFDEQGSRFKMWRNVVLESKDYSYSDWPFEGPSTVMHLLKQMHRNGGDARLWLQLWARQKNVVDTDRVMHEMRCLIDILYHGATFDQLNLPVLASMETASRRIQCIVEAYFCAAFKLQRYNLGYNLGYNCLT